MKRCGDSCCCTMCKPLHRPLSERDETRLIDQRDAAEAALSETYLIVTGRQPEWSNRFGYRDAVREIREECAWLIRPTDSAPPPAAMPGVGVVPTRDQLVSALQGAWDEFCGDAQAHPECFWREGRKLYADFDRSNFVQMVQYHLAAALSAAPPPAAESRAGEVKAENADGCPHCGSEFLGGDEENYPGWACGSYRMDNGQIVQEGDCERRELKRLLSEAPVPEPAAGESWDA